MEDIARPPARWTAEVTKGANETTRANFIVQFDGPDDACDPKNWPTHQKVTCTILYGLLTMGVTLSSAIYSTGVKEIATQFNVGQDVANLGTSTLLIGFGTGPLLWAPMSELFGRKAPVLVPYFLALIFTIGTAVATNLPTILATRFFVGFFGSAPIAITGGVLADLFNPQQRGLALVGYAGAVVGGPVFGPVAGGAIMHSSLGWRWTQYVTAIYMAVVVILGSFLLSESYGPMLLVAKARRMRLQTGNWAYHAKHEEWDPTFKEMTTKFLVRPLRLLATPVCFLFALHSSFVYSIVYLNLGAFPIIFQGERGWNEFTGSLPFLALLVGIVAGAFMNLKSQSFYLNRVAANNGRAVPEARLPPMMAGAISITIGLFIVGNTAEAKYHWIAPVSGAALMGFGFFTIFQAALNYVVDTFAKYGASAVAANTFLRSSLASIFPPLVSRIYGRLGIVWASNMLAIIALLMVPIPWVFYYQGRKFRAMGKLSRDST
ncbi:major facilitator superfamily domain-containing protein [Ilyonectria robusta]|uniref:major facilitator superfamily domain-containing protein n=1 Tax=Ilyonectria robusta TaxID=1079257 RepID=UPI001E8D606E|nr:major facilitator superfamily domain-containing protein [Ilyonectria robusta]KAH8665543.1 major facilitator superfamily domain-containing protein [Ilyonectria robusta]